MIKSLQQKNGAKGILSRVKSESSNNVVVLTTTLLYMEYKEELFGSKMAIINVKTEITGNVWKIVTKVGDEIEEDEPLMILESMKMEIPVCAPETGIVVEILTEPDAVVIQDAVVARIEVD